MNYPEGAWLKALREHPGGPYAPAKHPGAVPVDEAVGEQCLTCGAEPGAVCTYEADLFTPARAGKKLVHARGAPLLTGVHNARLGIVKARLLELRDLRIARLYRGGASLLQVAAMEGVSPDTACSALERRGVELRAEDSA